MAGGTMLKVRATAIALTGALTVFAFLPMAHAAAAAAAPISDEFNGASLGSPWVVQNGGNGAAASVSGGELRMTVPSGSQHDLYPGSEGALKVVQPIANRNFAVEAKFDSLGSLGIGAGNFQDEGIVVQQSSSTFLRFDVYSDGTSTIVFSASANGSSATQEVKQTVAGLSAPIWLRVQRVGATWLYTYSEDGANWTTAGSFTSSISAGAVGMYVGDSGPSPQGWTATVDYFHSIVDPQVAVTNDSFTGALNSGTWDFQNLNGGTQSIDGTHALINAPEGASHDPNAIGATTGDGAPTLLQNLAAGTDSNFSFDTKFDNPVTDQFQEQGVIVEQDASHYLHAEIQQNYFQTNLVVQTVSDSTVTTITPVTLQGAPGIELYNKPSITLRLSRAGDVWAFGYSYDGVRWTAAVAFNWNLDVAKVGAFAGNFGNTSSPSFTARIDSFVNTPTSTTAPVINVWYGTNQTFGAHGQPQQWVNILGDVSDPVGMASLAYSLNGEAAQGLSMGENDVRLVAPGEYNAEIAYPSLKTGANTVVLTAIDNDGNTSTKTVTVNKIAGKVWPLPYTAKWSSAGGLVNNLAQVADGHWTVQADGTIRNSDIGYDRLVTIGQASTWSQYVATAQVTIHSMDVDGSAVGLIAGFKGATSDLNGVANTDQPQSGHPFPAAFLYDSAANQPAQADIYANTLAHQEESLVHTSALHLTMGVAYTFKISVTNNTIGGSLFRFKVWRTGTAEPTTWLLQTNGDRSQGSLVLAAHRADVSFGTVSVVSAVTSSGGGGGGTVTPPKSTDSGYWMLDNTGHVYPFGDAQNFGSAGGGAVAIAARRDGKGYWTTDAFGTVHGFGAAHADAGRPALRAGELVATISATPSGGGYWLFTNQGRALPHGDARFFGDMSNVHLNGPIVSSVATPTGHGYYMVGSDGGVFSFGDAAFHGSTGNIHLNRPVVGLSPTPDNKGYWLVASDGGVFAFTAPFRGSLGAVHLNQPVNGIISFGNGYLMVASDGGVFDFSNKAFVGSLGGRPAGSPPVVGIVAAP